MAISKVEKELIVQGMAANTPSKGPFIQNMFWENDCWKTRHGFAQIAQFDTKFGIAPGVPGPNTSDDSFGYEKHLGSYLIKTDFEHYQIISVFSSKIHTGAYAQEEASWDVSTGRFQNAWIVSVYDVTDGTRYEQLLNKPTGDNNPELITMRSWYAHQETRLDWDQENVSSGDEEMTTFIEFDDAVFFGNPIMGLWYYKASKFLSDEARTGQSAGFISLNSSCAWETYGESGVISKVVPVPGFYSDGHGYLDVSTFSAPQTMATLGNRLCYAVGRDVYFSDQGNPNSVIATNQITIQSQELIEGMAEINGSLLIWTHNETFLYQPSAGTLVNAGRLTQISDNIGIISNNAFAKLEGRIIWMDINGVYSNAGTMEIQTISKNINQFFTDGIANPLNNYFQGLNIPPPNNIGGSVGTGTPMATTWYNLLGEPYVALAYNAAIDAVFISIPTKNIFLVLQDGNWHIWNFESQATNQDPADYHWSIQRNIALSWVLAKDDRVFIVGSVYNRAFGDEAAYGGGPTPVNQNATGKSYVILEQGVAGACDRSPLYTYDDLQVSSDQIQQSGCFKLAHDHPPAAARHPRTYGAEFVIGPPIKKPAGYVLPYNPAHSETTVNQTCFLYPVYLQYESTWDDNNTEFQSPTNQIQEPVTLNLYFRFDNTRWTPVTRNNLPAPHAANENMIHLVFPPARAEPVHMWAYGLEDPNPAANQQAQVWNNAGVEDIAGNQIRIQANFVGNPIGCLGRRYNLMFYIPFVRTPGETPSSELGIEYFTHGDPVVASSITALRPVPATHPAALYYYAYYDSTPLHHGFHPDYDIDTDFHHDPIEQPVDWVFKSGEIGLEEADQIRTRGIFCNVVNHGNAGNQISSNTYFGQFNALLGSDYKEWCSQIIDMGDAFENPVAMATTFPPNIQAIIDGLAIRTRWWNSHPAAGNDDAISYKVFGTNPDTTPLYGSNFNAVQGDYLVDDEQFDVISISDSVKGKYFTWMLFGHIRNWAEHLQLYSAKAVLRPAGGRRRKGRSAGGRV